MKAGTYRPDIDEDDPIDPGTAPEHVNDDREERFHLQDDLEMLGGFAGGETSAVQRNPAVNICILSGDIGDDPDNSADDAQADNPAHFDALPGGTAASLQDNSYHVLRSDGNHPSAVLDGFIIRGGFANGNVDLERDRGAGMFLRAFNPPNGPGPTIVNCILERNAASGGGGGLYFFRIGANLEKCTLRDNKSLGLGFGFLGGAGLHSSNSLSNRPLRMVECIVYGNHAYNESGRADGGNGGGINVGDYFAFVNCQFYNNIADTNGGAIAAGSGTLLNCLIRNNTALFDGGGYYEGDVTGKITNCTVVNNLAGTIGGIRSVANNNVPIENCIVYFNTDSTTSNLLSKQVGFNTPAKSCVQGWFYNPPQGGPPDPTGNVACDPLFASAASHDYRLLGSSPSIGLGISAGSGVMVDHAVHDDLDDLDEDGTTTEPTPDLDLNDLRIKGTNSDAGAYEKVCYADMDNSGQVDGADLGQLLLAWGTCPGPVPSLCCPSDFNRDTLIDGADLGELLLQFNSCPGGESMMGGESFEGGASTLELALNALGFADAEAFAAWGQEASPEQLALYGQLLSALLGG